MNFAEWVREVRRRYHLRAVDCYVHAGVAQTTWSTYENDASDSTPERATVEKVVSAIATAVPLNHEDALTLLREGLDVAGYKPATTNNRLIIDLPPAGRAFAQDGDGNPAPIPLELLERIAADMTCLSQTLREQTEELRKLREKVEGVDLK